MQKTFNVFVPLKDVKRQIDIHYTPEGSADSIFQMGIEGAIEMRLNQDKIFTGGAGVVCNIIPKGKRFPKEQLKAYTAETAAVFSPLLGKEKIGVKIALDPLVDGTVSRHIVSLCNAEDFDEYEELAKALKSTPAPGSFEGVEEFLDFLDADKIAIWITINFDPNQTIDIPERGFEISRTEQAWAMQGLESAIRFAAGLGRSNAGLLLGNSDITWMPKISSADSFAFPHVHPGTLEIGKDGRVMFLALFKRSEENYGYAISDTLLKYFRDGKWSLNKKGGFTMRRPILGNSAGDIEFEIAAVPVDDEEA